ncbi:MAG TPA: epoxide hydrolase [Chitinophagales bacterium]|nr:epoxide hydrolase [Chitinophagales bacterium]
MITSFKVSIPQKILDDLNSRIHHTRWTDEIKDSGWKNGASLSYMKELAQYWQNIFDWRKTENEINAYPNFIAEIDGYKIHFLHIKGTGRKKFPLIITHGWPGSFLEMMELIPLLTGNNEFDFDLVIPSLMGFGLSQRVTEPGCNVRFMADLWQKLMMELGYEKFGAQGGDFGAGVSTVLALKYPQQLIGLHLNYIPGSYTPHLPVGKQQLTDEEIKFEKDRDDWYSREGAYALLHSTKALTLAHALNDSPIGLCAWLVEKFHGWSDCKGDIESVFTKEQLLANVTLYWVTETIHSSIRLYNENAKAQFRFSKDDFVKVPVGIARFPLEEPFPPRMYIERGFNIQHWTNMPEGGHFAAMEQPGLLSNDIREFFEKITLRGADVNGE